MVTPLALKDRFSFVRRRQAPEPVRRLPQPDSHVRVAGRSDSRALPDYYNKKAPDYLTPTAGPWHHVTHDEDFTVEYLTQNAAKRPRTPQSEWGDNADFKDDDVEWAIRPSSTSNPSRPRTRALGYNPENQTLRVEFRDGPVYDYHDVTPAQWQGIKTAWSPGKWINRNLPNEYTRLN